MGSVDTSVISGIGVGTSVSSKTSVGCVDTSVSSGIDVGTSVGSTTSVGL